MVKESFIMVRVESQKKDRIASAAKAEGKSVTHLIMEAVMERVETIEKSGPVFPLIMSGGHCPKYFQAWCWTASEGGAQGYMDVGFGLLQSLAGECPWEMEEADWFACLEDLGGLLESRESDKEIIDWFKKYLPRFIEMIPPRRRENFIEGMQLRFNEEGIEI